MGREFEPLPAGLAGVLEKAGVHGAPAGDEDDVVVQVGAIGGRAPAKIVGPATARADFGGFGHHFFQRRGGQENIWENGTGGGGGGGGICTGGGGAGPPAG